MRGKEEPGGLCRSLFHAPPNRAAAAELWLSASLQACSAFLDTLIFQEMISVRFLYKNLSIFKFWQSHHCCCPIAIPDPPNHFPLAFVKAEKQRNSLSRLPAFKHGHMIHTVVSDSFRPMDCSTPGFPVHHQLPEFTQTHVHQVSDAIQPSHPLSSPSPPAPNPSQHQSLFQ